MPVGTSARQPLDLWTGQVDDAFGAVVWLDHVTKHYRGGGGVDDISLRVGSGEVFGFLGPNGAGKTTTIRLLLDLIRPDAGHISLFGLDSRRDSVDIRHRIGYLPGDLALYERLTPRELLTHFAHLRGGLPWDAISPLVERYALDVDRPIRSLSRGNRQKVGLVQALMGEPELLILDEPTTGLDPIVQHQVHLAIREVAARGRTVFLSSHVLSEVGQVADRVGMIRDGRLVALERVDELRSHGVHVVEATFPASLERHAFEEIPGITRREISGHDLHLEVVGDLDPVVHELAQHELSDLSVREPDLEDLFLHFYGEEEPGEEERAPTGAPGGADVAEGGADVAEGGADVAEGGADVAEGGADVTEERGDDAGL